MLLSDHLCVYVELTSQCAGVQQQAAKYVKCNVDNFVSVSVTTSPIWQIEMSSASSIINTRQSTLHREHVR